MNMFGRPVNSGSNFRSRKEGISRRINDVMGLMYRTNQAGGKGNAVRYSTGIPQIRPTFLGIAPSGYRKYR